MPAPVVTSAPTIMAPMNAGTVHASTTSLSNGASPAAAFGNILAFLTLEAQNTNSAEMQKALFLSNATTQNAAIDSKPLILPPELSGLSSDDLKSLLASMMGADDSKLSPQLLSSLTPGVPAKDVLENLKAQFSEIGIDISKLSISSLTLSVPGDQISVNGSDATHPDNLLLVATGLSPTDIDALKAALKSAADIGAKNDALNASLDAQKTIDANEASQAIILMVFAAPPQPVAQPKIHASDLSLSAASITDSIDLSSLSAFTQLQDDIASDADWAKKLSAKLDAISDGASPFDDEMNELLSFNNSFKKPDVGFQGSIATTTEAKAEASDANATISGDLTTQTSQILSNFGTFTTAGLGIPHDSLLLTGNGAFPTSQASSHLINPVLNASSAASAHPSVQAVATMIERAASGSDKAKKELSVELDPPELGRLQIQLSIEKDGPMKVHLIAEKQDTYNLLQRDSHVLKSALDSAGIQMDGSSLTFDFANGDQSFNQMMSGSQDQQSRGQNETRFTITADGGIQSANDLKITETTLDFTPDKVTGNIHYSIFA